MGILSLFTLAIATYARYPRQLLGGWRRSYVITAILSLYFNMFVLIAQPFQRLALLIALAPAQSEGPFKLAQLAALVAFLALGYLSVKNFATNNWLPPDVS